MRLPSVEELMHAGKSHHLAGRLAEAEAAYRQALALKSDSADAWHHLGLLAAQLGRNELALEWVTRAAFTEPASAGPHCSLGDLHQASGRIDAAVESYRRALALDPTSAIAHNNLGNTLTSAQRYAEAITEYRQALETLPESASTWNNLGYALTQTGQFSDGAAACRQALSLAPDFAEAHNNLGLALSKSDNLAEAVAEFRAALRLRSEFAPALFNLGNAQAALENYDEANSAYTAAARLCPTDAAIYNNLGNSLTAQARLDEADAAYRTAIRLNPSYAEPHFNLAGLLVRQEKHEEAIAAGREAIRLDPARGLEGFGESRVGRGAVAYFNLGVVQMQAREYEEAIASFLESARHSGPLFYTCKNLGFCYKAIGILDRATECYQEAQELSPEDPAPQSDVAYLACFEATGDGHAILAAAREWDRRHGQPLKSTWRAHENTREAERRLRIGYVSPDFWSHVVGRNFLPLLREHDSREVEVYCYDSTKKADSATEEMRRLAHHWREISGIDDAEAAELIRADRIDVLVDLTLHTGCNRLPIFARKPAPIQASYLGYCGTTGLEAMDYRLSDPHLDPADANLEIYSETTLRLPHTYWCYAPGGIAPESAVVPASVCGYMTFGCLNNFAKISPDALDLWAEILAAMPDSRLVLHAPTGVCRTAMRERLAERGVNTERLEFVPMQGWSAYMKKLAAIDVALDSFPYAGGISTCDALWMGTPVVTLSGHTALGRGGRSILHNIGLPELTAYTREQYREIALSLASDRQKLAEYRSTLRARMERSPLRDSRQFARDVEAAYRTIWRRWCDRSSTE